MTETLCDRELAILQQKNAQLEQQRDQLALTVTELFRALEHDKLTAATMQAREAELQILATRLQQELDDRAQIEAALRLSETRFSGILAIANDAIISINATQKITLFNQGAEKVFGYTAAEAIGQSLNILLPERFAGMHQHHVKNFHQCPYSARMMGDRREILGRRKDGTEFPAEASISKLEMGDELVFTVILRDVSERKQAETALMQSEAELRQKNAALEQAMTELQQTQLQLIQSEKMSSLGQLVAGVAHEINNPVNFIYGNLTHAHEYTRDLLSLLALYQQVYPTPATEIQAEIAAIELDFLMSDLPKLLASMRVGADRIQKIVASLRNFSRMDEAEMKAVDIHEGIESTLMILQNRLKSKPDRPGIQVIKEYGDLPLIECYSGQLNQVFMNILSNAIDALEEREQAEASQASSDVISTVPGTIHIQTEVIDTQHIGIRIADNGAGVTETIRQRLFDPFFTTKSVGKGTGMGLSISYQIITERHRGRLECHSVPNLGAEFVIQIPIEQPSSLRTF